MHFDNLLKNAAKIGAMSAQDRTRATMQFPPSWCQGRTAFGGLSVAILYQAIKQQIDPTRRLLSLSTNFVGPLLADIDFSLHIDILREGKNSTQVLAKAIQNGEVSVIVQACFAKPRDSKIHVPTTKKMTLVPVEPSNNLAFQSGTMPAFFQHIDLCPKQGNLPFVGAKTSHLGGWMKLKQQPVEFNEAHIIALTDAWPPTLLQMFDRPTPASSMSWYLEFVQHPQLANNDWLGFEVMTQHAKAGYALEDGCIWSQTGELIALTRQTVAVFD